MTFRQSLSVAAVTAVLISTGAGAAHAAGRDSDRDGIPNRFERTHGMNPYRAADASRDFDGDRLTNLQEYRRGTLLRDEDTDNDGDDDGDEVTDGYAATNVHDADTDDDGTLDGDEDADHDGVDNEDEDDTTEVCARDDDDRDGDAVDDEDENDFGLRVGVADSDGDGVSDGDEDSNHDGVANEDDDDADDDACTGDRDHDGEDDEDEEDLLGTIASFDDVTGRLTVTAVDGSALTGVVTDDTEIEFEDADGEESEGSEVEDRDGTTADLAPGVRVAELDFDRESGMLDEVEIYRS